MSLSRNFDLKLFLNKKDINTKPVNFILSYSKKEDFDNKGNFSDQYFNLDLKNPKYFWF